MGASVDVLNPRARTPRSRLPRTPGAEVPVAAKVRATRPGGLSVVSLSSAIGLLTVAIADTGSRFEAPWSEALFWIGILTLFVPIALRLALPRVARSERLGLVVLLGLGAYLVKALHSPLRFAFGDEYAHLRTAADILASGRLFLENPLSLASPVYPGLELVTTAVANVSGLSIYGAGLLVVGMARLILMLALFLLVERVSGSARVAGIAALVYASDPNFTFWSAQFAYESLALPLAVACLYLAVRRSRRPGSTLAFDALLLATCAAIVMTHHLTSAALILVFVAWAVVAWVLRRRGGRPEPAPLAALAVLTVWGGIWLLVFARPTFQYLGPVIARSVGEALGFLGGSRGIKPLFSGDPALVSPIWERVIAFGGVGVVAVALGAALAWIARSVGEARRFRASAVAAVFALGALAYYPAQALRAIPGGTEISNRSGEFLFLPVGAVIGIAIVVGWLRRRTTEPRLGVFAALATVVFMSGVIVGMPRWARMPGPYLVSGDTRAIQDESLTASAWLRATFGTGNAVIADQTNELLMGSLGGQDMRHGLSWIYFSPSLGRDELRALRREGVRFIVVDRRMTTMLPVVGYYYEPGEPDAGHHTTPMQPEDLARFDETSALTKVFDSGDIAIYELDAGSRVAGGSAG